MSTNLNESRSMRKNYRQICIARSVSMWGLVTFVISTLALGTGSIVFSSSSASAANTIEVPQQVSTISAAISQAQNGDTISVSPGTYHDNLNISGKYISIVSTNGPGSTVITPNSPGPVVVWQNVPFSGGLQGRLQGFTIENGSSNTSQTGQAGGITLANGADVQLTNDVVTSNTSSNPGGGIIVNSSNPVISNSTISNNSSASLGGGLLIVGNSNPTIYSSTITGNLAAEGGGAWIDSGSQPILVGDMITNNTANGSGGGGEGGGIGMRTSVAGVIEDSTFSGNVAWYGGAIDLETQGGAPSIIDNTFTNNSARLSSTDGGSGFGGAISVYNASTGSITGNQFQGNMAAQGGGAISIAENANIAINSNTIYNNSAQTFDGGGIYASNGTAQLTNNCVIGNTATNGGGIADLPGGNLQLSHNTVIQNTETRTDVSWIPGGIYVNNSAASFSSSGDLISGNNGPQIYDEGPHGSYRNDLLYPSSTTQSYLMAYGTSSLVQATTLSQIQSGSVNQGGLASYAPAFSNLGSSVNPCITSATSPSSGYGVLQPRASGLTPVYRFFGTANQTHFFTANSAERNGVLAVQPVSWYHYEGIAFYAYTSQVSGTVPVYRFFQLNSVGSHFYTASQTEANYLIANEANQWKYEGVSFYAYPPGTSGTDAVWRFVNNYNGSHFYTSSQAESNYVQQSLSAEWKFEGETFDVPWTT